jgi:hypothetical protein
MYSVAATCYHFKGLVVRWRGEVESVSVLHRQNIMEDLLSFVPEVIWWLILPFISEGNNFIKQTRYLKWINEYENRPK